MTDDDFMAGIVAGNLEVRLARSPEDVDAVQALRYRVFYEEMRPIRAARWRRANATSTASTPTAIISW